MKMTSDGGRQKNSSFFLPAGFSIIEVVAVLVILGIAGVMGFGILGNIVGGFLFSRDNVALAQKAHIALERIRIDLIYVDNPATVYVHNDSAPEITYRTRPQGEGTGELVTISFDSSAGRVYYNKNGSDHLLLDNVRHSNGLVFRKSGNRIDIDLVMFGENEVEQSFSTTVYIRGDT